MSSDRTEKDKCLRILLEVGQYVMQEKRDPAKVGKFLQSIISEPLGGFRFGGGDDKALIENLKMKTVSGKIKWKMLEGHSYFGPLMSDKDSIVCEEDGIHYEVSRPSQSGTDFLRMFDLHTMNTPAYVICLSAEDKKFFSMIFEGFKK